MSGGREDHPLLERVKAGEDVRPAARLDPFSEEAPRGYKDTWRLSPWQGHRSRAVALALKTWDRAREFMRGNIASVLQERSEGRPVLESSIPNGALARIRSELPGMPLYTFPMDEHFVRMCMVATNSFLEALHASAKEKEVWEKAYFDSLPEGADPDPMAWILHSRPMLEDIIPPPTGHDRPFVSMALLFEGDMDAAADFIRDDLVDRSGVLEAMDEVLGPGVASRDQMTASVCGWLFLKDRIATLFRVRTKVPGYSGVDHYCFADMYTDKHGWVGRIDILMPLCSMICRIIMDTNYTCVVQEDPGRVRKAWGRMLRKQRRSIARHKPPPYYRIDVQPRLTVIRDKQGGAGVRSWKLNHRIGVSGHTRMYLRKGRHPIEDDKYLSLMSRGYTYVPEYDEELMQNIEFTKRGVVHPEGHWLAFRIVEVSDHVRGPDDTELVPACRVVHPAVMSPDDEDL